MKIVYDDMLIKHLLQLNVEIQEQHRIYISFGKAQSALAKRNELINIFYDSMRLVDKNRINVPKNMRPKDKNAEPYVAFFNSVIKAAAKEREQQRKIRKIL